MFHSRLYPVVSYPGVSEDWLQSCPPHSVVFLTILTWGGHMTCFCQWNMSMTSDVSFVLFLFMKISNVQDGGYFISTISEWLMSRAPGDT